MNTMSHIIVKYFVILKKISLLISFEEKLLRNKYVIVICVETLCLYRTTVKLYHKVQITLGLTEIGLLTFLCIMNGKVFNLPNIYYCKRRFMFIKIKLQFLSLESINVTYFLLKTILDCSETIL